MSAIEEAFRAIVAFEVKAQLAPILSAVTATQEAQQKFLNAVGVANPVTAAGTVVSPPATNSVAAAERPSSPAATVQSEGDAPAPVFSYADHVQPLIRRLSPLAKPVLIEILKSVGAKTGPEIKPADYPAVVTKLREAIAAAEKAKSA